MPNGDERVAAGREIRIHEPLISGETRHVPVHAIEHVEVAVETRIASPLLLWIEQKWPRTSSDKGDKLAVRASRTEAPPAERAPRERQPQGAGSR